MKKWKSLLLSVLLSNTAYSNSIDQGSDCVGTLSEMYRCYKSYNDKELNKIDEMNRELHEAAKKF